MLRLPHAGKNDLLQAVLTDLHMYSSDPAPLLWQYEQALAGLFPGFLMRDISTLAQFTVSVHKKDVARVLLNGPTILIQENSAQKHWPALWNVKVCHYFPQLYLITMKWLKKLGSIGMLVETEVWIRQYTIFFKVFDWWTKDQDWWKTWQAEH